MDNKAIAIVAVVAVAILAVAAFAVANPGGNNDDNKYVVYDGNGGKTSDGSTTYKTEETVAIGLDKFVRDGYKLVSWNTKKDGSGTRYGPGANVMAGTTLYAQWEIDSSSKLTVLTPNLFSQYINFSLGDVNIDKGGEFSIPAEKGIYIRIAGTEGVASVVDGEISITTGGHTFYISLEMADGTLGSPQVTTGMSVYIPFDFTEGKNPQLQFTIIQSN